MLQKHPLMIALAMAHGVTISSAVMADHKHDMTMEEIIVEELHVQKAEHIVDGGKLQHADTSEILKSIPGASVNRNGGLTGIAQFRGFYGDRLAVSIDNASIVGGGPNAMDAPLSYVPASLLKELSVDRGATSVSQAQESLGGMIRAKSEQGDFAESSDVTVSGRAHTQYNSQNDASNSSLLLNAANHNHKLGISSSYDTADDSEFDGGDINSTEYERRRHDLFYGYKQGDNALNIKLGKNNTGESGTPALPMDITAIDSDIASFDVSTKLGDATVLWASDYSHVYHAMDNFTLRPEPMMGKRETIATGQQVSHKLMASFPLETGNIKVGTDYSESRHSATVYNPDMAMFEIENFDNAQRDISGAFVEWQQQAGDLSWELGLRANRVEMDADQVSASGLMGMMAMMANNMANAFNAQNLSETYNNRDIVFKSTYRINESLMLNANLSSKERAPSYQERYLWLGMQSTGGLADGKTYLGNLELDSETANELSLGLDYSNGSTYLGLHSFYRKVSDYIQGTPDGAGTGGMSGDLKYNNIDAKLYGGEFSYGLAFNDNWKLDGHLSYTRGKRDDGVSDNLYRIAPLHNQLSLSYRQNNLKVSLVNDLYDEQNKVSSYNDEEQTSGYSLWHINAVYDFSNQLQLRASVDNLTDKHYQDHLAGYNRVEDNADIAVGERLYGTGRSINLGATYRF
ncbi:MAG: TonB-dependent receptor [Candidatus Pelagadaptatus aseana]|uniref:TonB-dependent receptor plug domain-containing protein n=1 Tax=Candidatus Pelagadaptatus aseana TaxID=3120508 RepID=UPI0039B1CCC8